ncbi:S41 family peptidase [Bacteroides sp. UBA939]|uniref:S41 family peptidase n=1 Tax=Bacteroides sp. UBA939 TaxID=1946092 RepID=UPI0025C22A1D|nr:S41 family peptidase [Bacteroides sp. UBA939]
MNIRFLLFLFICFSLSACEKDDSTGSDDRSATLKWIENTMREHYYWYKEIPAAGKLNYTREPEDFFYSLLSKEDGKDYMNSAGQMQHYYFSTIEELSDGDTRSSIQEDNSYGFEFTTVYINDAKELYALILYVLKDSPAYEAGLRRGDWIIKINDKAITDANYQSLFGDEACTLTMAKWNSTDKRFVVQPDNVEIVSARKVEDNPVYFWDVIESPVKKKRIGYLVYNHFSMGKNDDDTSYDDKLKELSGSEFNGVDEFVLDLRYNNGGFISSGILLCSILQPGSALGTELGYMQYNDKQRNRKRSFKTGTEQLGTTGRNLNLRTLYVLVSGSTASASEMVINSLTPFMNVVVIGETTIGKNVGSVEYTSNDKKWEMHPIVCKIYNSTGFTEYEDGIEPDVELNEAFIPVAPRVVEPTEVLPLGNPEERLLKAAIDLIDETTTKTRSTDTPGMVTYRKAPINSIDRKATGSVIIDTHGI